MSKIRTKKPKTVKKVYRVLVEDGGVQQLITLAGTGKYGGDGVILWSELEHGDLPEDFQVSRVGGYKLVGDSFEYDAAKFSSHQAARAAERQAELDKNSSIDALVSKFKAGSATLAEVQEFLAYKFG